MISKISAIKVKSKDYSFNFCPICDKMIYYTAIPGDEFLFGYWCTKCDKYFEEVEESTNEISRI
jgi:hypothetical protein